MTTPPRRHAHEVLRSDMIEEMQPLLDLPYRQRRRGMHILFGGQYPRFLYRLQRFAPGEPEMVERLREVVVYAELWLSSPVDFNDPFDMTAAIVFEGSEEERRAFISSKIDRLRPDVSKAARRRRVDELMRDPNGLETMLRESFRTNMAQVGVTCFTSKARDIVMWSHYAENHTGIALQFEPSRDVLNLASAVRVLYAKQYPVLNWFMEFQEGIGHALRQKHEAWAYEGEFRCIRIRDAHTRSLLADGGLTGIILGCRSPSTTEDAIRALLAERARYGKPPVNLYRAEQHPRDYRLILRRLPA